MARFAEILHRWSNFLGDAMRLPLALVALNGRKTIYRLRRDAATCPCQSLSDSGRAMETHCEAVIHWHSAKRFRWVCPLLKQGPDGWRCSVDARDVRPFWGRAAAIFAAAVLALVLGAGTAGFVGLRLVGNAEVAWQDVLWPGRWHRINALRARSFCTQAVEAMARRDFVRARLALQTAVTLDPQNYDAALLLAMVQGYSTLPGVADEAFFQLMMRYPQQAIRSAVTYHDLLLGLGRPAQLAPFALWMAQRDPTNRAFWVRAMLVGLRVGGGAAEFGKRNGGELATLDLPAQSLLSVEILCQTDREFSARALLQKPLDPFQSPVYGLLQIEQLLRLADARGAANIRNFLRTAFDPFRSEALHYWVEQVAGNREAARSIFARIVQPGLTSDQVDWLTAMLVRAPDRSAYELLDQAVRANQSAYPGLTLGAAMWVAAVQCGDRPAANYWADFVRTTASINLPISGEIEFGSLGLDRERSVPWLLSQLPLPRETAYALYSKVNVAEAKPKGP